MRCQHVENKEQRLLTVLVSIIRYRLVYNDCLTHRAHAPFAEALLECSVPLNHYKTLALADLENKYNAREIHLVSMLCHVLAAAGVEGHVTREFENGKIFSRDNEPARFTRQFKIVFSIARAS